MAANHRLELWEFVCARLSTALCLWSTSLAWTTNACSDVVVYKAQEMPAAFVLPEGTARMLPGGSIVYQIPNIGYLHLHADTSRIIKAPTREERFRSSLRRAERQHDVEIALQAARFALHNGLLECFYEAARLSWKLDPRHPAVQRLASAEKEMRRPLQDAETSIERLGKTVPQAAACFRTSDHYVLMYNVDQSADGCPQRLLVKERLELLERVYRTFFLKFALEGKVLSPPRERLPVVLFSQQEAYLHYANIVAPNLRQSAGCWSPASNVAAFVNQDTHDFHRSLRHDAELLSDRTNELVRTHAKGSRDAIQFAGTMEKLADIMRDQSDVAVVTHEAVHQLAGNAGLIPRGRTTLIWAQEGLASYFETPAGAGWGGVGAVNGHRLKWYRALQDHEQFANIEFVVSDRIFDAAQDNADRMAAYGQAWALTHFLMETRFQELLRYYQRISELESSPQGIPRDRLVQVFDETFGDRRLLEQQWRTAMSRLDTNSQKLLEDQTTTAMHAID